LTIVEFNQFEEIVDAQKILEGVSFLRLGFWKEIDHNIVILEEYMP